MNARPDCDGAECAAGQLACPWASECCAPPIPAEPCTEVGHRDEGPARRNFAFLVAFIALLRQPGAKQRRSE